MTAWIGTGKFPEWMPTVTRRPDGWGWIVLLGNDRALVISLD